MRGLTPVSSANKVVWLTLHNATTGGSGEASSYAEELWATKGWASTPATGANAGRPGSWTPGGAEAPDDVATIGAVTAHPSTPWTTGQFVQTKTPGAPGRATWSGTGWVGGVAP